MQEETPVVDCHLSKDLEFARNLARQMKEGYGRHNSNIVFRTGGGRPSLGEYRNAIFHIRENQQARIIGRFGNNALRERWQDCAVGDAVKEGSDEQFLFFGAHGVLFVDRIAERDMWGPERVCFERVGMPMTSDNGITWNDEYIWKRIS